MSTKKLKALAERIRGKRPAPIAFTPDGTRRAKEVLKRPAKDVATQIALDALGAVQQHTLDELAILRQTRGQRDVGSLKIPANLQTTIPLDDSGVQTRAGRAGGDD